MNSFKAGIKKEICRSTKSCGGFTLVELMIALTIGLVILAALYNLFSAQNKSLSVQETIVEMQQNARAAMDMMATEMGMTGYDPAGTSPAGISTFSANSIAFTQDLNGDADVSDPNESIAYSYDSGHLRISRNTGGGPQPYAENVEALNYTYYNAAGATTATLADIRKIKIEIRTRTARIDPSYATNGGYRTYTLTSYVTPRNLAY
ncbi:MAG: prepilin-type N-terminal cleavage/methylation domain-containing protein [Syntrophus sp. (in: bacteria)]|nr:prepilin-type N-terminal cleavage/methylation domain-containing protein [Syntrophus sp. (in: bacteria)]